MSTMNNEQRILFLRGVKEGTMNREEQLRHLDLLLAEMGSLSAIAQDLKLKTQKIRFLQGLKNGDRRVEEIMPIRAEVWYHKEAKYRLHGTDEWITRSEYRHLPEVKGQLLIRMIYYL